MSVVIPARNEERWVADAVASVASQGLPDGGVEVVVVSNGSSDRTAEVARQAAARHGLPAILLELAEPGVSRAKNAGAGAARAELLVFLDADSRMEPDLLSAVLSRAEAGEQAASIRVIADGDDPLDRAFFWLIERGKRLFRIRANHFYCRRALFEAVGGFDERLNHAEDLDLLVRVRRRGVQVGHVAERWIATSPRRLHRGPLRLGMASMFGRWTLGHFGIGRRWPY